ncbi:MAG: hypothetical protein ACK53L_02185, partial [Pirellulaceae bacterium]
MLTAEPSSPAQHTFGYLRINDAIFPLDRRIDFSTLTVLGLTPVDNTLADRRVVPIDNQKFLEFHNRSKSPLDLRDLARKGAI